jgi:inorganic pyrophosphatase
MKQSFAVPVSKVDISFDNIRNITDVAGIVKNRIKHFFEHYKDMDKDEFYYKEEKIDPITKENYFSKI